MNTLKIIQVGSGPEVMPLFSGQAITSGGAGIKTMDNAYYMSAFSNRGTLPRIMEALFELVWVTIAKNRSWYIFKRLKTP